MGRRQGGYLGGSTIINPSRNSASADEGPPAALERARIENSRLNLDEADRRRALAAADERLTAVEDAIHDVAYITGWGFKDPIQPPLDTVKAFVADEVEATSSLGPGQRRRTKIIEDDYHRLLTALAADKDKRSPLLREVSIYWARAWPRILKIDRQVQAIMRARSR